MGRPSLPKGSSRRLYTLSRYVAEVANVGTWLRQPYVGDAAFAHKANARVRHPAPPEDGTSTVEPEVVGNHPPGG